MAVRNRNSVFQYKKGASLLHRIPALLKICLLLVLTVIIMFFSPYLTVAGIILMFIAAFLCRLTLREQLTDIKPALYYGVLLYTSNLMVNVFSMKYSVTDIYLFLEPEEAYIVYTIRLLLIMQVSALLFRTTTSIEIKDALCGGETAIRSLIKRIIPGAKHISLYPHFGMTIALTLNFIPQTFELWNNLDLAYSARGGGKGIRRIRILLFALLSLSFYRAAQKAKALTARHILKD